MTMCEYAHDFAEGNGAMADLLGGKGANLAEMTVVGLPVPPGSTITAEARWEHLQALKRTTGRKLGQVGEPPPVSVRSGARFPMPGWWTPSSTSG